jgi:hypothetical protein
MEPKPSNISSKIKRPNPFGPEQHTNSRQVMLLSFSGSRARIIHAHFDGSIFHFRHSRYYDFMDLSEETIDLFVRWLSNEPIGDTAIVAAMDDHNPGISHKSPAKSRAYQRTTGLSMRA